MTDEPLAGLNSIWQHALLMVQAGWRVIPLAPNEKRPIWREWQHKGVSTPKDVEALARDYPTNNYGMYRSDAAIIDIDLKKDPKATLMSEITKLRALLGDFELRFMQKTGSGGYHIPFKTKGREIHAQPLTDVSEIKGWHGQIVGAGSIHPETRQEYEVYGGYDPSNLTELSDEALDKLVLVHVECEPQQVVMPDEVEEHPPCVRYLLENGAPASNSKKEINYNQANLLLIDYAIARGYSDEKALSLAQEMARHTSPEHPTTKDGGDKIQNFRSALASARRDPERYQFACAFVLRSKTLKENACVSDCPNYSSRIKAFTRIPALPIPEGSFSMQRLLDANRKHLHVDEDYNVAIVPTVVVANRLPSDVDVVVIVGPSGSLKTELIREVGDDENQFVYPISTITEHTLASGLPDNEDLAPRLRGRTLVVKDLTSMLSKRDDIVGQIFADIRELTDGYIQKEYGSGAKKRHKGIHSSILAASTGAIERHQSLFNKLGSRLMFVRPVNDRLQARQRSWLNQKSLKIKEIRQELHTEMFGFIANEIERLETHPEDYKTLNDESAEKIGVWCDTLAILRTHIERDRYHNALYVPEPEFPTRLMNSICKLTQLHAFLYHEDPNEKRHIQFARRLVYDNIPTLRLHVLPYLLTDGEKTNTSEVSERSGLGTNIVRGILEDLYTLGICEKTPRSSKSEDENKQYDDYWLSDDSYAAFIKDVVAPVNEHVDNLLNRRTQPVGEYTGTLSDAGGTLRTYSLRTSIDCTLDFSRSNNEGLRKRIFQAAAEIERNREPLDEGGFFNRVISLVSDYSDNAWTPDVIKQYLALLIEDSKTNEPVVRAIINATTRAAQAHIQHDAHVDASLTQNHGHYSTKT